MRVSSITKNAGKACNNRLYRHIRTFEKIIKNYFVIYIQIAKYFCYRINHTINFEVACGILFLYQYGLLRFVTFILQKLALKKHSQKYKWTWLKRYIIKEKANMSVKSSSYAAMLFVYYIATNNSHLDLPIPLAINTLFLFDTFIEKEKEIQNN